ncbi:MAG: putative ABC transport system ATP-binding protein [Planctomycetota bacterium]|jgi:putative ABC transport system ATP-binding protein
MEPSLYKYILNHSRKDQIFLILLSVISLPLVYITLELPKKIINLLEGMDVPEGFFGYEFDRIGYLMLFSAAFLLIVLTSGALKYVLNVYRGSLGERLLRRFRYELYERILRFPMPHFKRVSQGELIPMITAETEPLGEFIGESYSLPVFQGGTLLTYLFFIFQQDIFLGLAAIALYPFQMYVIPRLQKKVNLLNKERVTMVRSLSGRIGETIAGINEVHTNDTSHYERAHISQRLGKIFSIRYAVYRRKFFIKFLNNFIAQLTPFFFYSVGGYFVLRGDLSIGAMVAVLVAYKDLSGPWKELLSYYQRREDIKVKYTQIIQQFNPQGLLDPSLLNDLPKSIKLPSREIQANNVRYSEDGLYYGIDGASFKYSLTQHAAAVGLGNSGKDELALLVARLISPSSGNLTMGEISMQELPEAITGNRIAYVGSNVYLFSGSVYDNICYSLKHQPHPIVDEDDETLIERQESALAGNSPHRFDDSWVDFRSVGTQNHGEFIEKIIDVLRCVEMDEEIYQFGLLSFVDQSQNVDLAKRVMQARLQLRDRFNQPEFAKLVEPFDQEKFNSNMSVSENLLFGTVYGNSVDAEKLLENTSIRKVLDDCGLSDEFLQAGAQIAEIMLDLFSDVEPDSELFEQYSFIDASDLPEFNQLLITIKNTELKSLTKSDQQRLMTLPFKLIVSRHRLGLIDESIQQLILQARAEIRLIASQENLGIEFFDEAFFNQRVAIRDNILFGKLAYGQANAQQKINDLIADVINSLDLRKDVIEAGLNYEVGVSGGRLSSTQRQKLGLARALIKSADLLIVNEALSGLDTASERRLIKNVREKMRHKGILWILGRVQLADQFATILVMERGRLTDQGNYEDMKTNSPHFQQLLAAE